MPSWQHVFLRKKISVVVDVSSDVQIALTLFIELMMRAGVQYTNDKE